VVYPIGKIDFYFFIRILISLAGDRIKDIEQRGRSLESCPFKKLLKEYKDEIEDYDYKMGIPSGDCVNPFRKK
jgi:hypothetical protein